MLSDCQKTFCTLRETAEAAMRDHRGFRGPSSLERKRVALKENATISMSFEYKHSGKECRTAEF